MLEGRSSTNKQRPGRCAEQILPEPDLLHVKNRHDAVARTCGWSYVPEAERLPVGPVSPHWDTHYRNRRNAHES